MDKFGEQLWLSKQKSSWGLKHKGDVFSWCALLIIFTWMHTCKKTSEFGNDAFNLTLAVVSNSWAIRISACKCYSPTILLFKSCLGLLLLEATEPPEDTGSAAWSQLWGLCVDGLCPLLWVIPTSSEQKMFSPSPFFPTSLHFKTYLDQTTLGLWTSVIKSSENMLSYILLVGCQDRRDSL